MAARLIPGLTKSLDISSWRFSDAATHRRRRAAAACLTGAALFVASVAVTISHGASARGLGLISTVFAPGGAGDTNFVQLPLAPDKNLAERHGVQRSSRAAPATRPVCVRLCDGFFFPAPSLGGAGDADDRQAACAGLCPDAPTALYYQPGGSDRVEDAVSAPGHRYSELPAALRYRSTLDNSCSCRRSLAYHLSLMRDSTLRRGDAVMTSHGFRVFRGVDSAAHEPQEFVALAASPMSKERSTMLQSLEHASATPQRGVTRSWLVAATPAPPLTAEYENVNAIRFAVRPLSANN